jgi:transposase
MQDTELYRRLLGLEAPWTVERVELDMKQQQVDVHAVHAEGVQWACPDCGTLLAVYDHSEERSWRHLDSMQFKTFLHARVPRVQCPMHGVKQVRLPWAEPRSRFTAMFECFAIDVLLHADVTGARQILRISWDEAWHIQERAVARGLRAKKSRVVAHLGVDEKAVAKHHKYMTLVCDLDAGTVEHIAADRKWESLDEYFKTLSSEQLAGVQAIALDMWDPYLKAIRQNVPAWEGKIVFDRFHIMKHVLHAVDLVRRKEHRELRAKGDETLVGSKYMWLHSKENLPAIHRKQFKSLREANLKTGRAYAIKENLRQLWRYTSSTWAERHWKRWIGWALRSRLKPIIYAANTLRTHLRGIMNFFAHPVTNAVSEGLNSKIQTVKKRAYGFRNAEHFRTAIFFHCGGLQLYPATHGVPG